MKNRLFTLPIFLLVIIINVLLSCWINLHSHQKSENIERIYSSSSNPPASTLTFFIDKNLKNPLGSIENYMIFDALFLGILLFICLFSLFQYFQNRDLAFLTYSGYLLTFFSHFIGYYNFDFQDGHIQYTVYKGFEARTVMSWSMLISYIFYLRYFFDIKRTNIHFYKATDIIIGIGILLGSIELSIGFIYNSYSELVELISRISTTIYVAVLVYHLRREIRNPLMKYVLWSMLFLGIGIILGWVNGADRGTDAILPYTRMQLLFFVKSSLLIDIFIYSIGLGYKNNLMIFENQHLQKQKQEAQRLKELDETKNALYTNITHEFRTPLTVIQGMAKELKASEPKNLILRNAENLLQMVNQMLDLSKLESGNMKANYIQDDIIPFLNYQTEAWSSYANTKHISLNFYSNLENLQMDFDAEKLEQIITNLLSNALKFTPEYGKIQVAAESENNQLVLIIKDTGIGIPTEKLSYIFDRFYQTDASNTRKGEGTGIGLALVKELVDLMEGKITVQSEVQKGTTFKVYLPIRKQAQKQQLDLEEKQSLSGNLQAKRALNIPITQTEQFPQLLIIEDNQDVIAYLKICLQDCYQILTAPNGKEGVQLAQKEVPDIIICDVMMPEMDGFEVCQILKEATLTCHIPIILLTAKATQIDKNEGLSYGADAYLTKPFDKDELLIRLENLIKIRRQIQLRFAQGDLLNTSTVAEISPKDRVFLNTLTQYIQDHIKQEDLEIIYLQKAVNMSRAQLHKKLKALTGMNASQFRKTVRLQEAKRILTSDTDLTIAEVAYQVGYKHPSHFSRDFKELFGFTPKEL